MAISEAKKRANRKWNRENMQLIAAQVTKKEAAEFEAACTRAGTTRSAVLLQAARDFIAAHSLPSGDGQTDSGTAD